MKRVLALVAAAALASAGYAAADSFTPVRLGIRVASAARLHEPLRIRVSVTADPDVLDNRLAPLRIEVKLSLECGANFQHTRGLVLLDKRLVPQPVTGHAYYARARGFGRPRSRGRKSLCAYLEEEVDNRVWAHDESLHVKVLR